MRSINKDRSEPAHSQLARLQQGIVLVASACLGLAAYAGMQGRVVSALSLTALVLTGHAWFLAAEMAMAAWVNRGDSVASADWRAWLRAWWSETHIAPRVFAWRQPWRWRTLPDTSNGGMPGAAPAVLIHGFVCNRGFWLPWMARMRAMRLPYVSVNLEPVFGSIDAYVPNIERAVRRAEAMHSGKPVLVCHSMGGLAARAWLAAHPDHRSRIGGVITIGSPHHGTWLARWSHVPNGQQMQRDSPWLNALARREREQGGEQAHRNFLCWYTHTDNIVFPASTAMLPGANNRHIPGAGHVDLAFHPTVMTESLAMLASAGNSPRERTDA